MPSTGTDLDGTLGAVFLGTLAASMLYGIISLQVFIYHKRGHGKDKMVFRRLIYALWLMDTLHLAFLAHALYYYLITNYGNPGSLSFPIWSVLAQIYTTCMSNFIVRSIFMRRVWFLAGRNTFLVICILIPTLGAFAAGFVFSSLVLKTRTFEKFYSITYLLYVTGTCGVIADSIIAITLCITLWRSRTGFLKTDTVISTLMLYTINTCLLTSLFTIACFIAYAVWPHQFIFLGFFFLLSKLYLNSLLAILNGRKHLRDQSPVAEIPVGLANIRRGVRLTKNQDLSPRDPTQNSSVIMDIGDSVPDLETQGYDMASSKGSHATGY